MQTEVIRQWIDREWKTITSVDWHDMGPDSNAYNTAWVATLGEPGNPLFPDTIEWLLSNQLDDGSWGSTAKIYYDQLLSTLMAVHAIHTHRSDLKDRINDGKYWIEQNYTRLFDAREVHNGIAFALLAPSIYRMVAKNIDFDVDQAQVLKFLELWKKKIDGLPIDMIMREKNHLAYSFEFLCGLDYSEYDIDVSVLVQDNGALGNSEAATAFAISVCDDEALKLKMLNYLTANQNKDGGFTSFSNLDVFNLCFLLYPVVKVTGKVPDHYLPQIREMVDRIKDNGDGIPMGRYWHSPDGDDTILALYLAHKAGIIPADDPIWMKMEYFNVNGTWYELYQERFGSGTSRKMEKDEDRYAISINIHVYDVLAELSASDYAVSVANRLQDAFDAVLGSDAFGTDRWHISPAYNNSQAILAFAQSHPEYAGICKDWFLDNQHENGLWGDTSNGSAFELTSFAVLALTYYHHNVEPINLSILEASVKYILSVDTNSDQLAALWLDKVQYRPDFIVGTAIAGLEAYLLSII